MNSPVLRNQLGRAVEFNKEQHKFRPHGWQSHALSNRVQSLERRILLGAGLSPAKLARVESLAARWNLPARDVAISLGAMRPQTYVRAAAMACGLDPAQVRTSVQLHAMNPAPEPYRFIETTQPAKLKTPSGGVVLNAENCDPSVISDVANALGRKKGRLWLATRETLKDALINSYGQELATRAADGLWRRYPRFSAVTGLVLWQIVFLAILAGLFCGAVIFAPRETLQVYAACFSVIFLVTILLRCAAASYAFHRCLYSPRKPIKAIPESELPHYSVLVALFREARILPQLVEGLSALDYPRAKLDIKLILEEVDHETIACAQSLDLPPHIEIVIVPDGALRTKPRALNYALQFARGEFLVIYDAEDRPDPLQLRMAVAHFAKAHKDVVCLQAQLTFDNYTQNWLAKQFTIEYASLFGGILPMLDRLRLPIPLGGTSNHFRVKILRKLGGWDAYNVTEDADLGMRIYRAGLRAEVLNSETLEEAACQPGNWLRQRTRWLKGWMQTYIVHMRQPWRLLKELGLAGFIAFQSQFAGILLAALIYPVSYIIIAHDVVKDIFLHQPETILGQHILKIAIFNLVAGFLVSFALGLFVLKKRHIKPLFLQILFIPIYWLFISAAAYRALYQLIVAPHYWEKTEHFGIATGPGGARASAL